MTERVKWDRVRGLQKALEKLVAKGFAASEIATRLSRSYDLPFSRSSVIARCRGTGLRLKGARHQPKTKYRYKLKPVSGNVVAFPVVRKIVAPVSLEPKPQGDFDHGCRFMHGDHLKERNFCCAPKVAGESWCSYHLSVCFDGKSTRASAERMRIALAQKENLRERRI